MMKTVQTAGMVLTEEESYILKRMMLEKNSEVLFINIEGKLVIASNKRWIVPVCPQKIPFSRKYTVLEGDREKIREETLLEEDKFYIYSKGGGLEPYVNKAYSVSCITDMLKMSFSRKCTDIRYPALLPAIITGLASYHDNSSDYAANPGYVSDIQRLMKSDVAEVMVGATHSLAVCYVRLGSRLCTGMILEYAGKMEEGLRKGEFRIWEK